MDLGIKGRTAVVLGAGGGLGGAIAHSLAAEGAVVAVCDLNMDAAQAAAKSIQKSGGQALPVLLDLAILDSCTQAVQTITRDLGAPDILINNSGGPPPLAATGVPSEMWRKYFDEMVVSLLHITDLVLPEMKARKWGRIITSTSSGVVMPIPNLGISNALRLTLVGWNKTLAGEVGSFGITANIVLPGRIATARIRQLDEARAKREGKAVDEVSQLSAASIALKRYGEANEYGDTVAFLASERASYITGSVIRVDGGLIQSI
jgi:3-oxoacyl-[acyl-carrier protein] reductase